MKNGDRFESEIIEVLKNSSQLKGYGLFGWKFPDEVDGLLLLEPGIFVCYEAKCYKGVWTGNINSKWKCDDQEIRSSRGGNPYGQVQSYAFTIKNKITNFLRGKVSYENLDKIFRIGGIVVVPDEADIRVAGAYVDTVDNDSFYSSSIHICHLSKFIEVLQQVNVSNRRVPEILQHAGGLDRLVEELSGNPEDVRQVIKAQSSNSLKIIRHPSMLEETEFTSSHSYWRQLIWIAIFVVFGSLVSFIGFKYYQFINKPRLSKGEVKIGILTKPEAYSGLAEYLEQSIIPDDFANFLFGQGKKINASIVGGSDLTYQQAKQSIIKNEWDIAFTLSPSLSVVAKEAGYQFIARMFPNEPLFYRSALFVRSDSPIQSIKDLNSQTKVGLGDFKSMSSFYMPIYDLYGKTLTIETGLKRVANQVKNGVVEVGAGVLTTVEKDQELRIIHVSRAIPSSGVYVTPSFSEQERAMIQQVLLNAPKEIQSKANYGSGKEPDYTEFMKIRTRVEEILSCADFSKNPVKLFCSSNLVVIKGKINGSTLLDAVTLELKVMAENGSIYKVIVPRFIIPNFTQVQNKSLILKPVKVPRQIDVNTYEVAITNSNQISIEDTTISSEPIVPTPEAKVPTSTNNPLPRLEAPSDLLIGYVAEVRDGDSLVIETPQNDIVEVRLACIDAPEKGQAPWGERSTQYIKQLLPVRTQISYRPVGRDRYERLVAEVFLNDQSINLQMVRQGEAVVYHRYLSSCETDRQKYLDAEAQAQREKLGFWNQSDPEMPWEFRRRYRN